MATRFFTREEANALLASVRPLAERMVEHRRKLARLLAQRAKVNAMIAGNGGGLGPQRVAGIEADLKASADGVRRCVEAIEELGGIVKDLDRGLVDFPARRGEEEVLLCWQLGEEEIRFWHGLEEGFAGRRELSG